MSHHRFKIKLLTRLRELGVRLEHLDDALSAAHSKDWEELAVEREGDEVMESLGAAGQAEIARITAALGRISDGVYGDCVACGAPILEARLELLPDTPFCKTCAAKH